MSKATEQALSHYAVPAQPTSAHKLAAYLITRATGSPFLVCRSGLHRSMKTEAQGLKDVFQSYRDQTLEGGAERTIKQEMPSRPHLHPRSTSTSLSSCRLPQMPLLPDGTVQTPVDLPRVEHALILPNVITIQAYLILTRDWKPLEG